MALVLVTGACSVLGPPDPMADLRIREIETQVWNNLMPGQRARCNATMTVMLGNTGADTLRLGNAEALLIDARGGAPVRRFPPSMLLGNQPVRELTILPGDSVEVLFRSPSFGLEPIDVNTYPLLRMSVRLLDAMNRPLTITGAPGKVFVTM